MKAPDVKFFLAPQVASRAPKVLALRGSGGIPPREILKKNTRKRHLQCFSVSQAGLELTQVLFKK